MRHARWRRCWVGGLGPRGCGGRGGGFWFVFLEGAAVSACDHPGGDRGMPEWYCGRLIGVFEWCG